MKRKGTPTVEKGNETRKSPWAFMHGKDFPILILAAGIILTIGVWDFSNRMRSEQILENTRHQADQLRIQFINYFSQQTAFLPRYALLFPGIETNKADISKKYWEEAFNAFPGMIGVQHIDTVSGKPLWTYVSSGKDPQYFDRLFTDQIFPSGEWRELSQKYSIEKTAVFVSSPLPIEDDKKPVRFIYVLYPVRDVHGKPVSYLIQYFHVELLIHKFFKEQNLLYYHYLVSHNWENLYSDLKYTRPVGEERPFKISRLIEMGDRTWGLNIWPKEEYLVGQIQFEFTGILVLTMGILFSISIALFAWSLVTRQDALEKLVHLRTGQLEDVNRVLKNKNDELESFIYVVSHDLKAPLVSIKGFTSLLTGPVRDKMTEEERHCVDRISANTAQMYDMLQDLLELSRVGRVEDEIGEVDTGHVVKEILDELKPALDQKHIQVSVNGDFPIVQASRKRLIQVFSNLIGNAIKYIGHPDQPKIEVGTQAADNNSCEFYVRDNGMGIPKEFQDKIFMVFQRGPRTDNLEGTGIGLSIVKKIIETRGGKIWVESEVGKGSTFYFTVPRS